MIHHIFGGIAALGSAFFWALGMILWRKIGEKISPLGMNFSKAIIGSLYLIIVLLFIGIEPIATRAFMFLGVSGLLGIALGDTFFFMSLINLGPRLASLMGTLAPVCTAVAAFLFLGERPSFPAWVGICLTLSGVAWVLKERIPQKVIVKNKSAGIKYSILSIVCMSAGILFAKKGVASVAPLQATLIRLMWGFAGLSLWGIFSRQLKSWVFPFKNLHLAKSVLFVVFLGTFGGFWLFLIALKYIDASTAGTLNSTSSIFILPLAMVMLKEKISLRAAIGACIAVSGIILILLY